MTSQTEERIRAIFIEELGIEDSEFHPGLAYGEVAEWDSVAHLHLVTAFEDEFELEFDDEEIADLSTFAKLKAVILSKIAADA